MSGRNGLPEGKPYTYQGNGASLSPDEATAALGREQAAARVSATRAVNGTSVSLEFAGKLAALTGLTLPQMLGPYTCGTCTGTPPAGFACLECGTEGERK